MGQTRMGHETGSLGRIAVRYLQSDRLPARIGDDVVLGLSTIPKQLPSKYFYDHRGSVLFEKICTTAEYYPWRTESHLLSQMAGEIVERAAPRAIIELGSGSSRKTRHLLDVCEALRCEPTYIPFDVCPQMLAASAAELARAYPWLNVRALVGDYTLDISRLSVHPLPALFVFLGGTIGNFTDDEIRSFLSGLRAAMHPGDRLLLGADLVKDAGTLHAAYNDAAGFTEAFNLNILNVINRELDGDFRTDGFVHHAHYNAAQARIEMRLVSIRDQQVDLKKCRKSFSFLADETVLTEISRKFTPDHLHHLLAEAGMGVECLYTADAPSFALALAIPRAD